jgi:hypothetical protein
METKFRGLDKNGIWRYGYLVRSQFGEWDSDKHTECDNDKYLEYETLEHLGKPETISYGYQIINKNGHSEAWVIIKSIGQYMGLNDKNAKEIYTGDIINYLDELSVIESEFIYNCGCCYYVYGWELPFSEYSIKNGGVEIVGNISQNPELIGGSK